jgi:hypothetical protein
MQWDLCWKDTPICRIVTEWAHFQGPMPDSYVDGLTEALEAIAASWSFKHFPFEPRLGDEPVRLALEWLIATPRVPNRLRDRVRQVSNMLDPAWRLRDHVFIKPAKAFAKALARASPLDPLVVWWQSCKSFVTNSQTAQACIGLVAVGTCLPVWANTMLSLPVAVRKKAMSS